MSGSYQRAAHQAFRQVFAAVRECSKHTESACSASRNLSNALSGVRSLPTSVSLASCSAMRSFRSECIQSAGAKTGFGGFAAAGAIPSISSAMPAMSTAAGSQNQPGVSAAAATGELTGEGDDEGTTSPRAAQDPPDPGGEDEDPVLQGHAPTKTKGQRGDSAAAPGDDDDEEDEETDDEEDELEDGEERVDQRLYGLDSIAGVQDMGPKVNMKTYQKQDDSDPMELLIFAKESFLKKDQNMIPIPPSTREVMYKYRWDKLLVDVRRSIDLTVRGRKEQYTSMVAVGNQQGLFGIGIGISETAQLSVAKAYLDAYNSLVSVPLYRGHTLYHHIDHEFHHMKIRMMPRPHGWGTKCSNLLTELCGLVGLRNVSIKLIGRRRNKFFVATAFLEALQRQSTPFDGVEGSGVYVREVLSHRKPNPLPEERRKA